MPYTFQSRGLVSKCYQLSRTHCTFFTILAPCAGPRLIKTGFNNKMFILLFLLSSFQLLANLFQSFPFVRHFKLFRRGINLILRISLSHLNIIMHIQLCLYKMLIAFYIVVGMKIWLMLWFLFTNHWSIFTHLDYLVQIWSNIQIFLYVCVVDAHFPK